MDYESIALTVVKVMKIPEPWVISIDRTDWQFGKIVFNVLTLGVVHHGVAFPLVWIMLDKKGNSNTRERCELWNRFLEIFGDRKIAFLTADREFVGEDWFDYLLCDPCTHFRIRIRKNTLLDDGQKELRADVCFQDLQVGQSKVLSQPSCGLREEQGSCYGDRAISSTAFHAGVAFTTGLSLPHDLTDQCPLQYF